MNAFLTKHPIFRLVPFQILAIMLFSYFEISIFLTVVCLVSFIPILFTRYYGYAVPLILILLMGVRVQQTKTKIQEYSSEKTYQIISIVDDIKKKRNNIHYKLDVVNSPTKLLLRSVDSLNVLPNDTLTIKCKLERPSSARNPGAFDYRKFLERKGISHIVSNNFEIVEIQSNDNLSVSATSYKIRQNIKQKIQQYIGETYSGLMMGLLLGEKGEIHPEIFQRFQQIGVVHILAVSFRLHSTDINVTFCCFKIEGFVEDDFYHFRFVILYGVNRIPNKCCSSWNNGNSIYFWEIPKQNNSSLEYFRHYWICYFVMESIAVV